MNSALFLGFIAATLVIAASPGPSVALASSQAIRHGRKAAFVTVLGDALGTVTHITVATLGLQALIGVAKDVLPPLQIAGGVYILYLAYRGLTASKQSQDTAQKKQAYHSAFISGFFACVSNPKAIVFFIALFPGFIDSGLNIPLQSAVYGASFVLIDGVFILGYALIAHRAANSRLSHLFDPDKVGGYGLLVVGLLLVGRGVVAL